MANKGDDAFKDFGTLSFANCKSLDLSRSTPRMGNFPVTASGQQSPVPSSVTLNALSSKPSVSSVHRIALAVSEEYDEYDEDQMLERAIDMGLNFEQALALISSGYVGSLLCLEIQIFSKQDFFWLFRFSFHSRILHCLGLE
jgi:hypothetical protein